MSRKSNSATRGATSRLRQDYLRLKKDPVPYVEAEPVPSDILEWHYVVSGPENTPYEGGYYHGKLVFPRDFPFKPPAIYMLTPNGRFRTNKKLCLSISDFHPDTWNPAWSVSTILTGLLSFMLEKSPTLGSIETSDYDKRQFAYQSLEYNLKDTQFCELFPETVAKMTKSGTLCKLCLCIAFISDYDKRQFAYQSLEYNLKDTKFCELFPETVAKMTAEFQKRSKTDKSAIEGLNSHQITRPVSNLQSCLTNLCVIIGFAAFAFTVKYVMKTTMSETE